MDASLTPLKSLFENARSKRYEHGQLILYAGDEANETLILSSGIVKVFDIDAKGQEKVLQIIKAPAILPLDSFFATPHPVSWHYSALTDSEVYTFSPDEFYDQVTTKPKLCSYILNWLAIQSHELLVRVNGMSKNDAKDRIIAVLKFFDAYYTEPSKRGWKRIEFPLTHQLLADITGVTRESITIQMGYLQKERIVRSKRPYLELNTKNLLNYHYEPNS